MDYNPFKSGATQMVQEKMDPVNKKELKGKHKDRKDKDIDNDGDVDGSDEYLHKRRKAISKADEGYYKDMEIKKQDKEMGAKPVPSKKKKEAKGGGKEGDVEMNPKMDKESKSTPVEAKEDTNEELQVYRVGHRSIGGNVHAKDEKDGIAQLRKKGIKGKITLTHKGPAPKPPKGMGESKIRSALLSVLSEKKNRDDHYKSSTDPEMMKDKIKGKGAEDMMKGANDEIAKGPDAHLDEPAMVDKDAKKMTSNVPSMKARKNDNMQGDKKIVPAGTPMKDPAAMKAESFGSQVSNISAAYAAMQEIEGVEEEKLDEYYGGGGMSGFQGQANRHFANEPKGVNPHHHDAHATAAYKSGERSKSAIIKHVEKQTGQKIHPDVHAKINNTPGMKD